MNLLMTEVERLCWYFNLKILHSGVLLLMCLLLFAGSKRVMLYAICIHFSLLIMFSYLQEIFLISFIDIYNSSYQKLLQQPSKSNMISKIYKSHHSNCKFARIAIELYNHYSVVIADVASTS